LLSWRLPAPIRSWLTPRREITVTVTSTITNAPDVASIRHAAMDYAAAGWPMFPCKPGSKAPATTHGFKDATTDPAVIRQWWSVVPYNVAIATGAPGPDVVHVDDKASGNGWAAYNRLKAAGLLAGASTLVRTRSSGLHVYFAGTDQRNAAGLGGAALDFRAAGGYVLAPPSVVDGAAYELLDRRDASGRFDLGAARRLLDPPKPARRQAAERPGDVGRLASWVARLEEGNRNTGLFWAACRAAEAGADLDVLVDAAVYTGLDIDEARRTAASAERVAAR
jgi:hypothetical protein